jgi:uncharacterized protein (TIGR03437 family)
MRAEGLAEKGGDFVLTCIGGTPIDPGAPAPTVDIQVFLNTNVTSRILTAATGATDALLLVDEPAVADQKVCPVGTSCPVMGIGASAASPYAAPNYNVWQGQWLSTRANSIIFNGVPIAPPGSPGGNRIFRVTNIRADANALGVVAGSPPLSVTEALTSSNPSILPISSINASQMIGSAQLGLVVTNGTAGAFQQCASRDFALANSVILNKGFAASFRVRSFGSDTNNPSTLNPQDTPGIAYNTEAFFYNPALLGGNAGTANSGTTFRIPFGHVQSGATIWVPVVIAYNPGLTDPNVPDATATATAGYATPAAANSAGASLIAILTSTEAGLYNPVSPTSTAPDPSNYASITIDSTGRGEAVYEVVQANTANSTENLVVPIYVSYTANPTSNIPALGGSTVGASFAPVSTATTASSSDPLPRFANTSVSQSAFAITACATSTTIAAAPAMLNFSYVTGSSAPAAQNIAISSSGPASGLNFTASPGAGCSWLMLSPTSGATPANLTASVNIRGLSPGIYACAITISAAGASNSPQTVHASLTVATPAPATTISVSPPSLDFTYSVGPNAPATQTIVVSSDNPMSGVNFTASFGPGCNWLTLNAAGGVTPANLIASASAAGLVPGRYACTITINAPAASNSPQTVHASLMVTQPTTISANPSSLMFTYRLGSSAPATRTIVVSSTSPASGVAFQVAADSGCGWVRLSAVDGTTPALVTASVNTTGLTTTSYSCTLTITAPTAINGTQIVQASLDVSDRPTLVLSPSSLTFSASAPGLLPPSRTIFCFAGAPVGFSATSSDSWLILSFSSATTPATLGVSINPAGLMPGVYQGAINVHSPASQPVTQMLPVTLNVGGAQTPPGLTARPAEFVFSFVQGAQQPQSRQVTITGSGAYQAHSDSPWLALTPNLGTLNPTAVLSLTADPAGLSPGTYTGSVTVSGSQVSTLWSAFVTMTISHSAQSLTVSQTGLAFLAAANGGTAPPQKLYLLKGGSGTLDWTLTPTTTSGGNWLTVSSTNGVIGDSPSMVEVGINAAGLPSGDYYGQLSAAAPGVENSPQVVGVVLSVSSPADLPPLVDPVGLIFTGSVGGPIPAVQSVFVTNRGATALSFQSSAYSASGQPWFTVQPAQGTISPGGTQQIDIQASANGLAPGAVYSGELNLGFGDNSAQKINILLVAAPAPPAAKTSPQTAASCAATSLVPLITSLAGDSVVSLGRPIAVQVQVLDDCGGIPQDGGAMQLDFSNSDPTVGLVGLPGGRWTGTVTPKTPASVFEISIRGQIGAEGTRPYILPLSFGPKSTQPVLLPQGVSSTASYEPQAAMAPGSLINIYGSQLADHTSQFSGFPLPAEIAGTRVQLGDKPLALMYVSENRIIAQVPYGANVDTEQQLVVARGSSQSAPETLPVAPAQPAVFTVNQQGTGQAIVTVGKTNNRAEATHPAKTGDTIVIYCAGLGMVNPPVATGAAAPGKPLSQTETPRVTIGGAQAQVLFSGLAPGSVGLYQVKAVVPPGVTPGNQVPLQLAIAGQISPVVTIAVR